MRLPLVMLLLVLAAPLSADRLQLKGEDSAFAATIVSFDGETVVYQRGRRELRAKLDDFVPASAFLIKQRFTPEDGEAFLGLARFALHRSLFEEAVETAREVARLDPELAPQAQRLAETARVLSADALLERGAEALHQRRVDDARALLTRVTEEFADTPAADKALILRGAISRVELAIKADALDEAARRAQQGVDEEEAVRRKPVDDWLNEMNARLEEARRVKSEGDRENAANRIHRGLPMYESVVNEMQAVRDALAEQQRHYVHPGQAERAGEIRRDALDLTIEAYERWVFHLYRTGRYETAASVCNKALRLAPGDRRLLSLKVDIDEVYDPLER
jgi:tetratricopeptide (TPR) repeat protein